MLDRRKSNSKHYLNMLMDASPNLIVISDGYTTHSVNQTMLSFLGLSSLEDFLERHGSISTLFEPHDPEALLPSTHDKTWIDTLLSSTHKPFAYIKKGDKLYTFKVHVGTLEIEGNLFYAAILNDITELEMQKERYAQAIEGGEIGIWDWDLEKNTIYFSPHWKSMLGYRDDELPNCFDSWEKRVHPEDLPRALFAIKENNQNRTPQYTCTHRLRHKNGHWVWIDDRGKTFFDTQGKAIRMVGVHHDVTRIKESEAQNEYYAKRSDSLLQLPLLNEQLDEASFMQSALEKIEALTHSAISFIHFVNDDEQTIELITWSNRTLSHYCHAAYDDHYPVAQAGIWADALRQHAPIVINDYPAYEHKKGLPEGHAMLKRFVSFPVIEEGKVVMLCGIGNKEEDYSENDVETLRFLANETWRLVQRKRAQKKLQDANELLIAQSRHAAMGEMVSMIAHQWRQPISVIGMCVNNMLLDIELDTISLGEFEKQLKDIASQVGHLSSTIDDFRNFFKPDKTKTYGSIKSVMENALKLMEKSFETHLVAISCQFHSEGNTLLYERELMQVFLNILKNAKEALEKKDPMDRMIFISIDEDEKNIITRIADNAGGIEPSIMEKIFEPYFSTKDEKNGTGLGLYMSKMIIQKHFLGSLKAYNHNEGACFEIVLSK